MSILQANFKISCKTFYLVIKGDNLKDAEKLVEIQSKPSLYGVKQNPCAQPFIGIKWGRLFDSFILSVAFYKSCANRIKSVITGYQGRDGQGK